MKKIKIGDLRNVIDFISIVKTQNPDYTYSNTEHIDFTLWGMIEVKSGYKIDPSSDNNNINTSHNIYVRGHNVIHSDMILRSGNYKFSIVEINPLEFGKVKYIKLVVNQLVDTNTGSGVVC